MNFLELVNEVNVLSGIQGSISDPASTVGIQSVIVDCTRNAWIAIQTYRKDWLFMARQNEFTTVIGQHNYTPDEVFATLGYNDLGFYHRNTISYDKRYLREIPLLKAPLVDFTYKPGPPQYFFIVPYDNSIAINVPDDAYTIKFWYSKTAQLLQNTTDIPLFPERYHRLIIYKGLEFLSTYMGNPELRGQYSGEFAVMIGELMREYIPERRVYPMGIA